MAEPRSPLQGSIGAPIAGLEPSGNVWATIYHLSRTGSDVAVASNRTDDPEEWDRAASQALRNALRCEDEAERWKAVARRMMIEANAARSAQ